MSRIFLAIILSCACSYASATTLYSMKISYDHKGHKVYNETMGFSETGFDGPSSVCYVGYAKDVCQLIRKAEGRSQAEYVDGGHGMFEVKSCNEAGIQRINLRYTRINDYDDSMDIELNITPCGGDE